MEEEKQILYNSDQSAVYEERKLKGWWTIAQGGTGKPVFWGKDEHMARWDGCTHMLCKECGENIHSKSWTCCKVCRSKHADEKYNKYEKQKWDGESPICIFEGDTYFFDGIEELDVYCDDLGIKKEDLQLLHCVPVELPTYDVMDMLEGCLCDEHTINDIPSDIVDAVDFLNSILAESKPLSWVPTNIAVELEEKYFLDSKDLS